MDTRREFIKKAGLLAGGAGVIGTLPASVQRALAINPDPGTTFYNAEHIVLLMQENRSFDHCFGTLQGVRGFNDPRVISLPGGTPAWLQTSKAGKTYAPFRLDIRDTKATWMSSLPHSWTSQVDARNGGRHDGWLEAKQSGNKEYAGMPLTMGYYNREDLPFYYALADAFTVCDQHFCSSLTGTTPNRLYYWTGTLREQQQGDSPANVDNSDVDYDTPAGWNTFPERLEANGISWKVYQNELSVDVGFKGEEDSWLANFTDNPLEWFTQYHVRFLPAHIRHLQNEAVALSEEIKSIKEDKEAIAKKRRQLDHITAAVKTWSRENFEKLPQREKNLHKKAFTTNVNDPLYHHLTSLTYQDEGIQRNMQIPGGDVLHQFRTDVKSGTLPTVSWIVAPENFSDHPGAPWYGAWYVSEVLDILTQNPEVWKKTIFILTYDENDGYFDHVPPFVAPYPGRPETGQASVGIDTEVDYVTEAQAMQLKGGPKDPERVSPVGLGYRVPFVVASPWSRGGWVNSQVFDHTSVLQFMEKFLTKKTGRKLTEENISTWRRAVCGDLTSVFRPYNGEKLPLPAFVKKEPFIESVYNAKFKKLPNGYKELTGEEINRITNDLFSSSVMPRQESGVRPSCALPYQLYAEGKLSGDKKSFTVQFEAKSEVFGQKAAGGVFRVYAKNYKTGEDKGKGYEAPAIRNYAVAAGKRLAGQWNTGDFKESNYHLLVNGPNGFFREYRGNAADPLEVECEYERKTNRKQELNGNISLKFKNQDAGHDIEIIDNGYGAAPVFINLSAGEIKTLSIDLKHSWGWYDFSVRIKGNDLFEKRYAGRVETGKAGYSDPVMGGVKV